MRLLPFMEALDRVARRVRLHADVTVRLKPDMTYRQSSADPGRDSYGEIANVRKA